MVTPVALRTANYGFQALEIPAGRHEVRVLFRPLSFELGALITALSLIAVLVWSFSPRQWAWPQAESRQGIR